MFGPGLFHDLTLRARAAILCLAAACLLLTAAAARAAPETPGAARFEYGYFCALEPVDHGVAEETVAGVVNLIEGRPDFLKTGPLVPAQIGLGFGVLVEAKPSHAGVADMLVTHPPMGPEGVTEQRWVTEVSGDLDYFGYTFDEDYELLPGEWVLSARSNGRLIYRVAFTVLDPALMPPASCGMVPMS
ncbi:DUF3859 domain-containing protein [Psychromarinibacter sp. C21-152]|uniref:DUF3859 domain-containing protein n=1 Tax=Psychromarinibacter sediminicola TaxID=3033385 RepID=A0AAE3NMT7_9RHOB|nr:DUF3859 domain-containing protein [Psychromarinibacter sediminicola]MDF0600813.1 DUF3859 domain-containing protein [Psychromarinibacter sediminicola]